MKRLILAVLLLALCAGRAHAETLAERYWRLHRERNATTRYGAPPTAATNSLPAGYRLLEYVEATGPQWVDTGRRVSAATRIDAKWTQVEITSQQQRLYGIRETGLNYFDLFWKNSQWHGRLFASTSTGIVPAAAGATYTAAVDAPSGKVTINGTTVNLGTTPDKITTGTLPIFGRRNDGAVSVSYPAKMRLHWFQIRESGTLVLDLVPVADANGVAGLWDRESGQMFYSATSTPLVAGPELRPATVLPTVSRETVREMLAPAPTGEPPELAGGDLWLDCLAIPEGNWLCECPIEGSADTAWRAALCPSNILRAVVWRHAVGLAPTNLPVTLEHDPSRVIGRIERLYYEAGTGVVARISITQAGYAWAVSNHCTKPSPDTRCFTTGTNVAIRTDGWIHEHQDYIEARCVPRGEDMSSVTNVPAGVQAIVMAPVYLRGLSLVGTPLLPTYIEQRVPDHLRNVYPLRPPRQWDWRNGY